MKYQVHYNKTKISCQTLKAAEKEALNLLQADQPFEAKIVEVDKKGEFVRTVKRYNSCCA